MSLSLLGIIFVQGYWISTSYQTKEDQFTFNIRQSLISVSKEIQLQELDYYYKLYSDIIDSVQTPDNVGFKELIYTTRDEKNNETYVFSNGILEEDYKLSSVFLDTEFDTIQFRKLTNRKSVTKIISGLDGNNSSQTKMESFSRMEDYERDQFKESVGDISAKTPIHKRVSAAEINRLLSKELKERAVKSDFEFAVYSKDLATKIRSRGFELNPNNTYGVPLFVNENLNTSYQLYVSFSEKEKEVLGSILGMAILSLIFTAVIILAYASALTQLFRQRQISQIKSDFINNMTHEFKTPIATINLALDAMNNPKVKDDKDFIGRYMQMIRDENHRMHAQVETVLRISKLEKNELDLPKEKIDLHEIIEDAISHVSLIVENRGGYIKTHFGALNTSIYGNELHLTNVIVNILDNGIKYSNDAPNIDIYSENVKNTIVLKIRDQGIGMSKSVQKKIFEQFYRETHWGYSQCERAWIRPNLCAANPNGS